MPENNFRTLAHDVFKKSDLEVGGLIYDIFDDAFLIDNVAYLTHTLFMDFMCRRRGLKLKLLHYCSWWEFG